MNAINKAAAKKTLVVLLIIAVLLILGRLVLSLLARVVDLSVSLINVLALPLVLFVLFWFVYRLWGKPYFRAWHINRIRNARYLKEVLERGKENSN
jgi:lysylphosphatidylglycerol synthetase-like protein (DUF2156 family)